SEGISDSIINNLSQLPTLKVIALSSVLRYKGQQADPHLVGRELNVRAILTGRLIQRGDGLAISVELVDARDNRRLWGGQYNLELADIQSVQAQIAREISQKLEPRLSGQDQGRLTRRYTESSEAYQLYIQARYYRRRQPGKEGWEKGIDCSEQA